MKKSALLFFFIPFLSLAQHAEEQGIHFEQGTFAELLAAAKKENKMIMVDAFTTWCGPCKWMAKNIFPNDTVADFYNKNFVNATIDMEKGEGINLAKKYQVSCYPTFLYIDGNGQLLHRQSGSMTAQQFLDLGQNAMNPVKQFASVKKKYDSGTATAEEMADYVLMRSRTCLSVKEEAAKYFATQKEEDLTNQKNWEIMRGGDVSVNSREFIYLVNHRSDYEKLYDPKQVNSVIENSYYKTLRGFIKAKNSEEYGKLKKELMSKGFSFSEKMILTADVDLYKSTGEWASYAEAAVKLIDKYGKEDYNQLNNMAWGFYEHVSDKTMLAKAEEWSKHSVELNPGYFNYDTYASVLFKLGKKPEAQSAAQKAIELAKKEGSDYKETEQLLEKIRALQ